MWLCPGVLHCLGLCGTGHRLAVCSASVDSWGTLLFSRLSLSLCCFDFFLRVIEIWVIFCSWKVDVMHIHPAAFSNHLGKGVCVWESKLRLIVSDIPCSWQPVPWISTEWSFPKQGECTSWRFCCFPSYGFIYMRSKEILILLFLHSGVGDFYSHVQVILLHLYLFAFLF